MTAITTSIEYKTAIIIINIFMFHLHVLQSLYSPEGGKNRPVIPLSLFEGMY